MYGRLEPRSVWYYDDRLSREAVMAKFPAEIEVNKKFTIAVNDAEHRAFKIAFYQQWIGGNATGPL